MASPLELKITRYVNGDALVDTLNGPEITLKHTYNPKPGDGESDISETVQLVLEGAQATVQSTINSINRYLADARKRNENGYGDRVYIEARAGTAAEWRRSEITDGRISVTDDGMQAGLTSGTRTNASLSITRRGFWENTAGTFLPIYNSNGTAAATADYINIFNCPDGVGTIPNKRENWVRVAGVGIGGDLPAPVLTYVNQITGSFSVQSIYAGKVVANYGTAALSLSDYYRDQGGTIGGSADASCVGGYYLASSITTNSETDLASAPFSSYVTSAKLGGAPYHVLVRFRDNSSLANVRFRLKVVVGTDVVWSGPQFMLSSTTELIQDMGVVNLPPGLASEWYGFDLHVFGTRTTSSTETVKFDFIQLFGSQFTKLQMLRPSASGSYKYGGSNNIFARTDSPGSYYMDVIGYGAPSLTVTPGRENAFMFLANGTATAPITNNMAVRMSYRPRWSSPL